MSAPLCSGGPFDGLASLALGLARTAALAGGPHPGMCVPREVQDAP